VTTCWLFVTLRSAKKRLGRNYSLEASSFPGFLSTNPRIDHIKFTFVAASKGQTERGKCTPPTRCIWPSTVGQAWARTQTQQTHFCCQGNWPKSFLSNRTFRIVLPCLCFFQLTAPCRESSGVSSVHHFFEKTIQLPTVEGRRLPNLTTPRFKQTTQCSCLRFTSIVA
jgi:hypothetical protein